MSCLRSTALTALTLVLVTSCASEPRSTDPSAAEVPFQSGLLSGTTLGRIGPAQTTTGPGATLTGLVGTFTSLSAGGPAAGNVATVYFTSRGNASVPEDIWQIRTDGTGLLNLSPDDTIRSVGPSIAPSGSRLLFWQLGPIDFQDCCHQETRLMERLPDGTTRQLATDLDAASPVSWNPDEKAVIYPLLFDESQSFNAVIRRVALDNGTPQDLLPRHPGRLPELTVGSVNGHPEVIYQNAERGLNRFDLTSGTDSAYLTPADSDIVTSPALTRDGHRLLFVLTHRVSGESHSQLRVAEVNHPEAAESLFTFPGGSQVIFGDPENAARWLPDGSGFVVTAGGAPQGFQLHLLDASGHLVRQLTSLPLGIAPGSFSVGPPRSSSQALIGEGGLLGSTASGIIFGQDLTGGLTTVVGFQSDRPRSVTLKANTGLNSTGPALTYTLTAERLRTLRFINDPPDGNPVTVVDSTSLPAGGALINFDADNGQVTVILPFAEGQSQSATVTESGGARVFRGHFLGVWKGRTNLAPRGATEVKMETATGRVEVSP